MVRNPQTPKTFLRDSVTPNMVRNPQTPKTFLRDSVSQSNNQPINQ